MSLRHTVSAVSLCALAGLTASCATGVPPQELVAARVAYTNASSGAASALTPVPLDNARRALSEAETAFHDHGDALATRDLAYVAERRSLEAVSIANAAVAQRQVAGTQTELARRQTVALAQTSAALGATRQALAIEHQDAVVAQQQVTSGQQALDVEHRARTEAERTTAAALESLRQIANVREEARGIVITLSGSVLFATGQSLLLPIAQQRLQQVAAMLHDHQSQNVVVEGHTDSRGSASTNQALSLSRAQAVRDLLVSDGVPSERIRAEGYGPSRPVADNNTADGRADNRRVEIVVAPDATGHLAGSGVSTH
jgi:outer membrane protein OmpA-like peptidoglycan-associated protein